MGTNRWFLERYNVNNARFFNGNNGNLNNNNVNNRNRRQAVSNLLNMYDINSQINLYLSTRKNKRYGRDQMEHEANWVPRLVREARQKEDRTFRTNRNYAFLVSRPRWREIFATAFEGRMADHEVCDILIPLADKVLSPRTFNNRKGMGAQGAMNQVAEDMYDVSEGYTREGWIIKLDLKGYFPSARWDYAEKCLQGVIAGEDIPEREYYQWLISILVNANPAAHCERRTPAHFWAEHIEPEKSLFSKPEGVGAAIGRLIWQTAMGLYINDDIIWLNKECGIRTTCFVDDIVMIVPDERRDYALSLIPMLRQRFAEKGVRLNEKKFYCQPIRHGLEFLGSHIRPNRIHLNNKTYGAAIDRIREYNGIKKKEAVLGNFISTVNSYTGLLKNRTDHKRIQQLIAIIAPEWWEMMEWNEKRQCVVAKEAYNYRNRLNKKYNLKLKSHDRIRENRCA